MDQFLKSQFQRYGINPDTVKIDQNKKVIDKDKKWNIALGFFKEKYVNAQIIPTKSQNMILFIFDNEQTARVFLDAPSVGLLAYTRNALREEGLNPKEYNLSFNFSVTQDEKNTNPKAVIIRLL